MTKLEIQLLLDEAKDSDFLNSIEILDEKQSEYKKSDFFKKTRIPLLSLYEKYFAYYESQYSITKKINEFIYELDKEELANLLVGVVEKLNDNNRFKEIVSKALEQFDINALIANNEDFKKAVSDLKIK